ncbi:hypothetical protein A0H81_08151 [Grifola frondosa]|uniref:Cytochrome P450 n=1 Tax=Grifola frondosa TaxID=5627 RepID=A0A1C7M5D0_GRIFR|nr:hypothetical protein A0H81_08151 [Grifola frondosa]
MPIAELNTLNIIGILGGSLVLWVLSKVFQTLRIRFHSTALKGPPNPSLLSGIGTLLINAPDSSDIFEAWAEQYGLVYSIPAPLGATRVVLCDPKALLHFYSLETFTYIQPASIRIAIETMFGRGLVWAEGESHKRQRKAISPAFSNAAIRRLTPIFYDSAYKVRREFQLPIVLCATETLPSVAQIFMGQSIGIYRVCRYRCARLVRIS